MNDMRKIMEAIDEAQIDEMPGRSRSAHEKHFDERHPSEVLQYFGSKRHGGDIKDGYEAYSPFDSETRRVDSISIQSRESDRVYHMSGSGGPRGRADWITYSLSDIKIYKITREQVL